MAAKEGERRRQRSPLQDLGRSRGASPEGERTRRQRSPSTVRQAMDANGARELSKRLEAQEHWRQAAAVLRGEQSATDPYAHRLEELSECLRPSGTDQHRPTMARRPA